MEELRIVFIVFFIVFFILIFFGFISYEAYHVSNYSIECVKVHGTWVSEKYEIIAGNTRIIEGYCTK